MIALAVAASLLLTVASGTSGLLDRDVGVSAQAILQQPEDVFDVPALVVAGEAGESVQTYDAGGSPTGTHALEDGFIGHLERLVVGHWGPREDNSACIVHARSDGALDFCLNRDDGFRFDADFVGEADEAIMGEVWLGVEHRLTSDQLVIARGSTGIVEIYLGPASLDPDNPPDLQPVFQTSFDAEFSPSDSIFIADTAGSFNVREAPRTPREGNARNNQIVIVDGVTGDAEVYGQRGDLDTFRIVGGFKLPTPFDQVAVGNIDPLGNLAIATASSSTGAVTVFDWNAGRNPTLQEIASFETAYSSGDSMVLADVHGNKTDSILIADGETGLIDIYSYTFDPDDPIRQVTSVDVGFPGDAEFAVLDLFLGDIDNDGLFDIWEIAGLDANGNGDIDIDLPALPFGADPLHKDLYVEYDWVSNQVSRHEPNPDALAQVVDAFDLAPIYAGGGIHNPSGRIGINLHIDTGQLGGGNALRDRPDGILQPWNRSICDLNDDADDSDIADFYEAKTLNFDPLRAMVFRYAISAPGCPDSPAGQAEAGGNDFVIFNAGAHQPILEASTFMHELGHTLGLLHGGSVDDNCKPNYPSIMSYANNTIERVDGAEIIDFAPPRIDDEGNRSHDIEPGIGFVWIDRLDERSLDETTPLDPEDPVNTFIFRDGNGDLQPGWPLRGKAFDPDKPDVRGVDWNGDEVMQEEPVPDVNIDNFPYPGNQGCINDELEELGSFNDWVALSLPFQRFGDASNGPLNPHDPGRTMEEIIEFEEELHTTDLAITGIGAPDTVVAGEELVYTLTVSNEGPRRANFVQLVDTLPEEVTYLEDDASCSVESGVVTCDLGQFQDGDVQEINITVQVNPDVVFDAGGPTTLTNLASVSDQHDFAQDPNPDNNNAEIETDVVAEADLEAVELAAPDDPVGVILDDPSTVRVVTTITNHGPSSPIDAELQIDASPVVGVEINQAGPSVNLALGSGELRRVIGTLNVHCTEPGLHTITLTGSVSPLHQEDTDPNVSNNQASGDLTVECITPVAIDIKPGSNENPVNMRGNVPVAVLTSEAGEYDLPVAFDATAIDPQSVLFGPRDSLFGVASPAGADEFHDRGHPEDVDGDGDLDMMLHFRASESRLEDGAVEACIRGEYTTAGGDILAFFGCDVIRIVPS